MSLVAAHLSGLCNDEKRIMKNLWQRRKKWIIAGLVIVARVLAFVVAGPLLFMRNATATTTTTAGTERVEAFTGDLSSEALSLIHISEPPTPY